MSAPVGVSGVVSVSEARCVNGGPCGRVTVYLADDWEKADWSVVAGICFCTFFYAGQ